MQALGPGSDEPAALLAAAAQYHADQDTKCETILDSIRHSVGADGLSPPKAVPAGGRRSAAGGRAGGSSNGEDNGSDKPLAAAVCDCAEAAGWVVSIASQRELLRAAIYGRSHAPAAVDAALIPLVALHCRLVNSLRQREGVRCRSYAMHTLSC